MNAQLSEDVILCGVVTVLFRCLCAKGVAYQSPGSGASASAPWVRPNERILHRRCYIALSRHRILIDHDFRDDKHGFVYSEE